MTRKMLIMMIAGVFAVAMPAAVLAGDYGMEADEASNAQKAAESVNTVDADIWPASGPVETGAVPQMSEKSEPSLIDTFYDPFHPELREIDRAPGG